MRVRIKEGSMAGLLVLVFLCVSFMAAVRAEADDITPPTGTAAINNGAAFTNSKSVHLHLSATDDVGIASYYMSTKATAPGKKTKWISAGSGSATFDNTVTFNLAGKTGMNMVYVWFKDTTGNTSASAATASITYDKTAPKNGKVTPTPGDGSVQLVWTGFSDAGSGITEYKVAYAAGKKAPANCSAAQVSTADTSSNIGSLTNDTQYAFRVCAVDGAGNLSKGATTSAKTTAPGGGGGGGGGGYTGLTSQASLTIDNAQGALLAGLSNSSQVSEAMSTGLNIATQVMFGGAPALDGSTSSPTPLSSAVALALSAARPSRLSDRLIGHAASSYDNTIDGACAGLVHAVGNEQLGSLSVTMTADGYNGCSGAVINGVMTVSLTYDFIPFAFTSLSIGFDDLTVTGYGDNADVNEVLNGSVSASFPSATSMTLASSVVLQDNTHSASVWLDNVSLGIDTSTPGEVLFTASGRVYDSGEGYVEMSTPIALRTGTGDAGPYEGEVIIAGHNSFAKLDCIDGSSYTVSVDADGDGDYEWTSDTLYW